ncbi:MAG: CYTH domain-containing protein [Bacteroidetes bacterium]|nr:CYTH domain-containing protein [Bacteroidota bacterium]MBM3425212.1 CYTH domain-containing protein [Bacteroidota bacterium]
MKEIERKFLVKNLNFLNGVNAQKVFIQQAYLIASNDRSLRIRIKNEKAFLTLKIGTNVLNREEFEYEIPLAEGQELLGFCSQVLTKLRYTLQHQNVVWEIDVFQNELDGLYMAEVELEHEHQLLELPEWVGEEVTHDPQYLNINLIKRL